MKKYLPILMIAAISAVGFAWWRNTQLVLEQEKGIAEGNGRIELTRYDIATLRAGRVLEVPVSEGDTVDAGTVLARLSSDEAEAKLAAAKAARNRALSAVARAKGAQARAEGAKSRAGGMVHQAEAEIATQEAQLAIAQEDLKNARQLRKQNLISASELTQRQKAYDARQAAVNAAKAAQMQAKAGAAEADAAIAEARAGVEEAQAAVAQAEAEIKVIESVIADLTVTALRAGRVKYTVAGVGNVVAAGSVITTIVDPADVSMDIFLPTPQVARIALNAEARLVIDGIDAVFPASVSYVADRAQFTPKYVETKSERASMMYRVTLKMTREASQKSAEFLKGGMSAVGYVRTDPNAAWPASLAVRLPADEIPSKTATTQ
ncbi:putative efflux pump membrane fusion protein [Suttonella ornithocola]|uniref:Putative efflux pump membrane fusion protein n=2 Tax=Suttonella ornithocola TaxID=279832 RepID=A0A380MNT1_9GAMM|nr:putative efflux pump membrane fusion protein [Suttonella ornithocola]